MSQQQIISWTGELSSNPDGRSSRFSIIRYGDLQRTDVPWGQRQPKDWGHDWQVLNLWLCQQLCLFLSGCTTRYTQSSILRGWYSATARENTVFSLSRSTKSTSSLHLLYQILVNTYISTATLTAFSVSLQLVLISVLNFHLQLKIVLTATSTSFSTIWFQCFCFNCNFFQDNFNYFQYFCLKWNFNLSSNFKLFQYFCFNCHFNCRECFNFNYNLKFFQWVCFNWHFNFL